MASLYTECNCTKFRKRVQVASRKSDKALESNGKLFEATVLAKGTLELQSTRSSFGVVGGNLTMIDSVGIAGLTQPSARSIELRWRFPVSEWQAKKELSAALAEKLSNNAHVVAARV